MKTAIMEEGKIMTQWLTDDNGNKCSVEYFGTREAAQAALDGLKNCNNCVNCSDCSRCSDCSGCSDCSRCSRCSGLSYKENVKVVEVSESNNGPPTIPVIPNIHQSIYAAASNPGALEMGDVHTCENTHCRAGWAIALAGAAGRALEKFYNWELAAMMIYDASDPNFKINPARFYDSNENALADMKKLAEAS